MKRALFTLFAVAVLVIPATVLAGQWKRDPLRWLETYQGGSSGTAIVSRDTLFDVIAGGQTDTLWAFSIKDARVFRPFQTATVADTFVIAWLVFSPDSAGVADPTVSSITVEIDGRAGGYGANTVTEGGWAQVDSIVAIGHSVRGSITVPLRVVGGPLDNPVITTSPYNREYRLLAYPELRARITAATGVMSACKVHLRYWADN